MDPIRRGDRTEAKGFQALAELRSMYPEFVHHFRRSSPEVDARGIDAFVIIALPPGLKRRTMTVPLEFKSSSHGVAKWRVVHSDLHKAGVLVFFFPDRLSPRRIRRLIFRALTRVRLNSRGGKLYHSMFQRLFRGGSKNLWRNIEIIQKKRSRERERK